MIGILSRLGGLGNFSSVLFFCLSLFLLVSVFRKQLLRIFLSLVFSIFLLLQLISLYFTQSFIGYQFISHFNLRGTTGIAGKFIPHLCFSALLLLVSILVFALSNKYFYKIIEHAVCHLIPPKTVKIVLIVFSLLFLFFGTWAGSFIADSKSLISIISNNKSNFTEVLKKYGMEDYITPEQVTCTQGKNIVIISLESYEKAYFSEKYQHLTPHLQQLKKEWNYFELEQNYGSNWTSGSLYTVLTGFPAYFGIEANDIFQQVYHSEISSISAIWDKTGYHSSFYNGNANFSGTKEMVHALGFHSVIDYLNIPDTGQYSKYGIRDKDLFEHAQREIKEHKCNNQPFAVFISTSDTHMPNGMYDKRMEQYIEPKENDLEFMVAAVDYMVGDFVGFLKKEKMLNETAVFIFPDHLKMGDPLPFENTGKRGLFLLSNTLSKQDSNKRAGPFFQIDLPKLILEGAGIQHNLKFLTDYIGKDKKQFVQDNILALTEINTNGLLSVGRPPLKPSPPELTAEQYRQDTFRYIAHAGELLSG
jgi:lipoteichoic acid synthase